MRLLIIGGNSSLSNGIKSVFEGVASILTAGRIHCDLYIDLGDDSKDIQIPDNIDVVIHTAAHFGGKSDQQILDAEKINVLGTLKLCQAAVTSKTKHFVFISSIFSNIPFYSEKCNIYSLSKKHAEELIQYYCSKHSIILTILKPSQLYGSEESFRKHQPFFYHMVDKAEKGEDIELYGTNDPLRNFIHIEDLSLIIKNVILRKLGGIYQCPSLEDISYSQIAKSAFKAFSTSGDVVFLKDKPDIPDNVFEKDDSLYKLIEYYPRISIEEGLQRIAEKRKI